MFSTNFGSASVNLPCRAAGAAIVIITNKHVAGTTWRLWAFTKCAHICVWVEIVKQAGEKIETPLAVQGPISRILIRRRHAR